MKNLIILSLLFLIAFNSMAQMPDEKTVVYKDPQTGKLYLKKSTITYTEITPEFDWRMDKSLRVDVHPMEGESIDDYALRVQAEIKDNIAQKRAEERAWNKLNDDAKANGWVDKKDRENKLMMQKKAEDAERVRVLNEFNKKQAKKP